jgi:hypothetical protein
MKFFCTARTSQHAHPGGMKKQAAVQYVRATPGKSQKNFRAPVTGWRQATNWFISRR